MLQMTQLVLFGVNIWVRLATQHHHPKALFLKLYLL